MKKKAWEVPPHLRDRRGDIEQMKEKLALNEYQRERAQAYLKELEQRVYDLNKRAGDMYEDVQRYRKLRSIGAVVMDDECKHLQGAEMDAYLDNRRRTLSATSLAEMLEERIAEMARNAIASKLANTRLIQGDTVTIKFDDITLTST